LDATAARALLAAEVKVKYKLYYADSFAAALVSRTKQRLSPAIQIFEDSGTVFP